MSEEKQVKMVECLVYSRVVGFLRPVSWWNKGKQQEWNDRKTFNFAKAVKRADK